MPKYIFLRIVVPAGVGADHQPAVGKIGHVEPSFDRPVFLERARRPRGEGALSIEQAALLRYPPPNGEAAAGREAAELQMKAVRRREQRRQALFGESHAPLERVWRVGYRVTSVSPRARSCSDFGPGLGRCRRGCLCQNAGAGRTTPADRPRPSCETRRTMLETHCNNGLPATMLFIAMYHHTR